MEIKKIIEQSIMFAIESLSKDIREGMSVDTAADVQSIKTLAEAYDIVHRAKGGK